MVVSGVAIFRSVHDTDVVNLGLSILAVSAMTLCKGLSGVERWANLKYENWT